MDSKLKNRKPNTSGFVLFGFEPSCFLLGFFGALDLSGNMINDAFMTEPYKSVDDLFAKSNQMMKESFGRIYPQTLAKYGKA